MYCATLSRAGKRNTGIKQGGDVANLIAAYAEYQRIHLHQGITVDEHHFGLNTDPLSNYPQFIKQEWDSLSGDLRYKLLPKAEMTSVRKNLQNQAKVNTLGEVYAKSVAESGHLESELQRVKLELNETRARLEETTKESQELRSKLTIGEHQLKAANKELKSRLEYISGQRARWLQERQKNEEYKAKNSALESEVQRINPKLLLSGQKHDLPPKSPPRIYLDPRPGYHWRTYGNYRSSQQPTIQNIGRGSTRVHLTQTTLLAKNQPEELLPLTSRNPGTTRRHSTNRSSESEKTCKLDNENFPSSHEETMQDNEVGPKSNPCGTKSRRFSNG